MKRIVCLDIDGVLNTTHSLNQGIDLLPHKIQIIERICVDGNADVVISSDWRIVDGIESVINQLTNMGLSEGRIIGETPDLAISTGPYTKGYEPFLRGKEVRAYIRQHEIESYVIIDDIDSFLPEQKPHFILTDDDRGIQPEDIVRALEILEI